MADVRAAGAIYDLGYQRYEGTRLGRANAVRTLVAFSLRTAFGIGRGARAKATPFGIAALIVFIALFRVAMSAAAAGTPMGAAFGETNYPQQISSSMLLLIFFAAAQAPELVVADRQQRVLSLYLSRPLGAADYALGKLGAFFAAMLILTLGPQLVLMAGAAFNSATPWDVLVAEAPKLWRIVAATVLISLYMAVVALALGSFTARRAYGTAAVMAFFLLLAAGSQIVRSIAEGDARRYTALLNPTPVLNGFATWLIGAPAAAFELPRRGRRPPEPPPTPLDGELYLYVILATIAVGLVILLLRYRKAEV